MFERDSNTLKYVPNISQEKIIDGTFAPLAALAREGAWDVIDKIFQNHINSIEHDIRNQQ